MVTVDTCFGCVCSRWIRVLGCNDLLRNIMFQLFAVLFNSVLDFDEGSWVDGTVKALDVLRGSRR